MARVVLDGKRHAAEFRATLGGWVERFSQVKSIVPGLAVILIGENPRSQVYVRAKARALKEVGMRSFDYRLSVRTTQAELLEVIADLNRRPEIHGILLQLPLPSSLRQEEVLETIDPKKDVDGFHPLNVGLLSSGRPRFIPCTPLGCTMLLSKATKDLRGRHALIIGRSLIVGRPMAQVLLLHDCSVTVAHSHTRDLAALCSQADIVIAAAGSAEMVKGTWIKPEAVVLDVGITSDPNRGLIGDVAFQEVRNALITPVPGGVGPMTVACLLANTFLAACRRERYPPPEGLLPPILSRIVSE